MSAKPALLLTPLCELELLNALELRAFRKELSRREVKRARGVFEGDRDSGIFLLQPSPTVLYEFAGRISRRRTFQIGARTLDILHVASALILKAEALYTFDERQRRLADAEGLSTIH
jgi:predicted nucleic acid-binding protein